jgi:chromosome segregation ATPase
MAGSKAFVAAAVLAALSCRSAYYSTLEAFGKEKRDILVDRVESAQGDQEKAKQQFQTTLEKFKAITGFQGGDLEKEYDQLKSEYDRSVSRADDVRGRISSIQEVAGDLFDEWKTEAAEIQSPDLRRQSEQLLRDTRDRYDRLLSAMQRAEGKMTPVLTAFHDQVLFLKHNLNARAIASLQGNVQGIETDVQSLIAEMERSIAEANTFIASMKSDASSGT